MATRVTGQDVAAAEVFTVDTSRIATAISYSGDCAGEIDAVARLRQRARAMTGASAAGLAQRLIDEGLRMADHPGVIFKDGPSGRRAALAYGPDVWEVIKFLREIDERGPAAIDAAAEVFAVDTSRVSTAISYYGDYVDEIDAEIADADEASARAEAAWRVSSNSSHEPAA